MVTMSSALAQQSKDVTNSTSNMKSFKSTAWLLPQPVLIIGTYDKDGKPDVEKMGLITFDPVHHTYIQLGKTVGKAFSDGKQLK